MSGRAQRGLDAIEIVGEHDDERDERLRDLAPTLRGLELRELRVELRDLALVGRVTRRRIGAAAAAAAAAAGAGVGSGFADDGGAGSGPMRPTGSGSGFGSALRGGGGGGSDVATSVGASFSARLRGRAAAFALRRHSMPATAMGSSSSPICSSNAWT